MLEVDTGLDIRCTMVREANAKGGLHSSREVCFAESK